MRSLQRRLTQHPHRAGLQRAALSLHAGTDLDDVDIQAIQKELGRQGVRYE